MCRLRGGERWTKVWLWYASPKYVFFLSKAGWLKGPPPIYGKFQSTTNQLDKFNRLISENMCICICMCTCVYMYMLYVIYIYMYMPMSPLESKSSNPKASTPRRWVDGASCFEKSLCLCRPGLALLGCAGKGLVCKPRPKKPKEREGKKASRFSHSVYFFKKTC